ncbi:hypothetical protein FRB90_007258 [Tulasnella sp. 427]|nr:hypothetical protein FRB90_007258 [Tulasnella sp. 427]
MLSRAQAPILEGEGVIDYSAIETREEWLFPKLEYLHLTGSPDITGIVELMEARLSNDAVRPIKSLVVANADNVREEFEAAGHDHALLDSLFLQKTFGKTMQPTTITPYYYRASHKPDPDDITITTQITNDRFEVFAKLVDSYQGPVSVTVHVTDNPERRDWTLAELGALYTSHPLMSRWVDVHLVVDNFERQFNMWRNVGRFLARTDYVFMLDVDFIVCTDLRRRVRGDPKVMEMLRKGDTALVVPAFEYVDQQRGVDARLFPAQKKDLLSLVDEGAVTMFHAGWELGHGNTDYARWYKAKPGKAYQAKSYQHSYEPYVIMKKQGTPWCDERFVGYGANKAACLFEIYLSGVSFYVLPEDFLIHQSHLYPYEVRKNERRYNRKLYAKYRNETCSRYLEYFSQNVELEPARAKNAREECARQKLIAQ